MPQRLSLAIAAAALALAAAPAHAGEPWDGPALGADPGALLAAASALTPPKNAGLDLLLEEGAYRLDARGATTVTHRVVYRVLTLDAARAWARVERSWAPWHQARPDVRARIVTAKGEVHVLDPATLTERGAGDDGDETFTDRRVLAGPLPGVRVGSVVELVTVIRDEAPVFDGGTSTRFYLAQPSPVRHVRVTVQAPAALPLRWVARGEGVKPVEQVRDGVRTISVDRRDVPATPPVEPNAPRDVPLAPNLAFGWGRSWQDVAERYGAIWERQLRGADLSAELRAALGGGKPARAEAIRRILAWVHANVRYTGLELGQAAIVPTPPGETLKRRYGDCKDLSLLVVGLLRAAGIEARLALVRSDWRDLDRALPGISQFDHAIVRVEGAPPVWIDATAPYSPPGALPPQVEGRLALVTGKGVKDLVRTPESGPADNFSRTVREVRLPEIGKGRVVETRELRGAFAAAERAARDRIPADRGEELHEKYAKDVFGADELVSATVEGQDDPGRPLRTRVEATGAAVAETEDDEADVPVAPDQVFDGLPPALLGAHAPGDDGDHGKAKEPPARKADLLLGIPYRSEVVYRLVPPDGFRARPLPAGSEERFGPARFTQAYALEKDGTVTVTFRLDTGGRRLSPADADALGKRARAIIAGRNPRVRFERTGAALLAAGKVPEALAEVRRLAALHPQEALHHLHLALALLHLGYRDAAVAEARTAVTLEPKRAWALRVLGYALEHDAIGRYHGPGFDHAGALAAYRQAKALDPDHAGGRAVLAELLAHAPDGTRFGRGARLDEAIAEYQAIRVDLDDRSAGEGHLGVLLAAGRFADAEALARELPRSAERDAALRAAGGAQRGAAAAAPPARARPGAAARDAALLAAVGAQRGADAADEESRALGEGRREALREAARLLAGARTYAAAPGLVAAAAQGAPNAAELRQQAEAFEGIRRWEALRDRGDDVERLVRRAFVAAVAPGEPAKNLDPLLARGGLPADLVKLLEDGAQASVEAVRRAVGAGIPADVFLDLTLSKVELLRDGDPKVGLRLRLRFPGSAAEHPPAIFAVRDGKDLRIVATDSAWPILGEEALRRAAKGDLEGARRWLDWAGETLPGAVGDPASPAGLHAALWKPGAAASAPAVRRAAAALLAWSDPTARTASLLVAARAATTVPEERRALGFALLRAYTGAKRWGDVLETANDLLAADPASRDAFGAKVMALDNLGRRAELDAAAAAMLARLPGDPEVIGVVGSAYTHLGDPEAAARTWRLAIDAGRATPIIYNNAAWLELYRPAPAKEMLEWARRATSGERDHADLNTLAAVLATLGRAGEARQVFLESLDAEGRAAPGPSDWYVFGRIAEAWGLPDAARDAYGRVTAEPDDPTAPEVLAR
ncbi:DUF3857 domain-containing protein, partial [Anaeromyxobacter oryzisoli]|uniref:DUF3857 domain-containing protein n=1 Tax=Anaeromyxobacter oryzisoli TaxID=2925408 RepID=UPI001F5AA171